MAKRKRRAYLNPLEGEFCPACGDWFETVQGLMAHLSNSQRCAWYKKGKLKAVFLPAEDSSSDEDYEGCELAKGDEVLQGSDVGDKDRYVSSYLL